MKELRTIMIDVEPPELIFVEGELMVMLLDTIEITPQVNRIEYFGKTYSQEDKALVETGRWGMQKFDKLNTVGSVNEDNEFI
jgi:hypothetical protein